MAAAVPVLLTTMAVSLLLLKYATSQKANNAIVIPHLKCAGVASPPASSGPDGGAGAGPGVVPGGNPGVNAGAQPPEIVGEVAGANSGASKPAAPSPKDGGDEPASALAKAAASEPAPQLATGRITTPGSEIELECPAGHTFLPPLQPDSVSEDGEATVQFVYMDVRGGNTKELLQNVIPGATGTAQAANMVTLNITQLPNTSKIIYLHCVKTQTAEGSNGKVQIAQEEPVCAFEVTVASPPPQGPQLCAVSGATVMLGIPREGDATQFMCGLEMDLSPDDDKKKAYSEDCFTEVDLKDMTLTHADDSPWYTLRATKKPPKKTICYLCESDVRSTGEVERCTIKIALRGSSRLTARPVIGVALPFVLASLHVA